MSIALDQALFWAFSQSSSTLNAFWDNQPENSYAYIKAQLNGDLSFGPSSLCSSGISRFVLCYLSLQPIAYDHELPEVTNNKLTSNFPSTFTPLGPSQLFQTVWWMQSNHEGSPIRTATQMLQSRLGRKAVSYCLMLTAP